MAAVSDENYGMCSFCLEDALKKVRPARRVKPQRTTPEELAEVQPLPAVR